MHAASCPSAPRCSSCFAAKGAAATLDSSMSTAASVCAPLSGNVRHPAVEVAKAPRSLNQHRCCHLLGASCRGPCISACPVPTIHWHGCTLMSRAAWMTQAPEMAHPKGSSAWIGPAGQHRQRGRPSAHAAGRSIFGNASHHQAVCALGVLMCTNLRDVFHTEESMAEFELQALHRPASYFGQRMHCAVKAEEEASRDIRSWHLLSGCCCRLRHGCRTSPSFVAVAASVTAPSCIAVRLPLCCVRASIPVHARAGQVDVSNNIEARARCIYRFCQWFWWANLLGSSAHATPMADAQSPRTTCQRFRFKKRGMHGYVYTVIGQDQSILQTHASKPLFNMHSSRRTSALQPYICTSLLWIIPTATHIRPGSETYYMYRIYAWHLSMTCIYASWLMHQGLQIPTACR